MYFEVTAARAWGKHTARKRN